MARYVFLFHDLPPTQQRGPHFDLMFEAEGGLQTWAVLRLPTWGEQPQPATPLPLHRTDYLNYEGKVSGGRGTVSRVQSGTYERLQETADRLVLRLSPLRFEQARSVAPSVQLFVFEREDDAGWTLRSMKEPDR